jgi:hypothetical protein
LFLDATKSSNDDTDEKQTEKFLIKCILESKARRYEYLKYVVKYPKIMTYLLNDNPNCINIPLRYLEPFIKEYVNKNILSFIYFHLFFKVDKNPNGKIYDKINQQIQDIRHNYLKNCL